MIGLVTAKFHLSHNMRLQSILFMHIMTKVYGDLTDYFEPFTVVHNKRPKAITFDSTVPVIKVNIVPSNSLISIYKVLIYNIVKNKKGGIVKLCRLYLYYSSANQIFQP